jgi:hypothetical protein
MRNTILLKRVNGQSIQIIEENGDRLVPIKPICEMLGIDFDTQYGEIYDDEILGLVFSINMATEENGEQHEEICLPLKYIFGWLFTIHPDKVDKEAHPEVMRYKLECHNVLFEYFVERVEFVSQRKEAIEKAVDEYWTALSESDIAKMRLENAEDKITRERKVTFEEWKKSRDAMPRVS